MGAKRNVSAFATPAVGGSNAPVKIEADGGILHTVKAASAADAGVAIAGESEANAQKILKIASSLLVVAVIVLWLLGGLVLRNVNL